MRNALAHAPAKQRGAVAAMLKTIFAQESKADAVAQWDVVADALREKQPKLTAMMDSSREDVLAYMDFPREHWPQIASTNPLERINKEIKRRSDVVGIFPNDDAIVRLVGALMIETQRRMDCRAALHGAGNPRPHHRYSQSHDARRGRLIETKPLQRPALINHHRGHYPISTPIDARIASPELFPKIGPLPY